MAIKRKDTTSFIKKVLKTSQLFCDQFIAKHPEVDCVLVTGSIARGDCFPDLYGFSIDICIIHTKLLLEKCIKDLHREKFGRFTKVEFSKLTFVIETIEKEQISSLQASQDSKYYAVQESIVLYSRDKTWEDLSSLRIPDSQRKSMINAYFQQAVYHINNYRISKWVSNKNLGQCQLNLNDGFLFILKQIYLLNNSFIPRADYLFYLSSKLKWLPRDFLIKANKVIFTGETNLSDILERRKILAEFVLEIKSKIETENICHLELASISPKISLNFNDSEILMVD